MSSQTDRFQQIFIIGRTQLAAKCAEIAAQSYPSLKTRYFNIGGERPPRAAEALGNLQYACVEKKQLMDALRETAERTLLFSVMNNYLFPPDVAENPALLMINLHHALLPRHPGRNAEAWAIFEGDETAGVTWHLVTADVDAGAILSQHEVRIGEDMTSLSLYRELNRISVESFPQVLKMAVESEKLQTSPQPADGHYPLHYAKDRPGDGVLSPEWDIGKMDRFLRAMDYGILKVMGDPAIWLDGQPYTWKKYALADAPASCGESVTVSSDEIRIAKNGKELRLIGVTKL